MTPTPISTAISALDRSGRAFEGIAKLQAPAGGDPDAEILAFAKEMTSAAAGLRELQERIALNPQPTTGATP